MVDENIKLSNLFSEMRLSRSLRPLRPLRLLRSSRPQRLFMADGANEATEVVRFIHELEFNNSMAGIILF
jgi:hypothetical protein